MNITLEQVNDILKTLPLSYYYGNGIEVKLTDTMETYWDYTKNYINIGYKLVLMALQKVPNVDEENLEIVVRGLLYHELSHCYLTPAKSPRIRGDIYNIFEDERIETLLFKYYKNTDFWTNRLYINGYDNVDQVKDDGQPLSVFYNIVRFRKGKKEYTDRVAQIIKDYATISNSIDDFDFNKWYDYQVEIEKLFNDIATDPQASQDESQSQNGNGQDQSQDSQNGQGQDSQGQPQDQNGQDQNQNGNGNQDQKDQNESENGNQNGQPQNQDQKDQSQNGQKSQNEKGQGKNLVAENCDEISETDLEKISHILRGGNPTHSQKLMGTMKAIIEKELRKQGLYATTIHKYSGKFNPKDIAKRYDKKWWTKQNQLGDSKNGSVLNLTLFIDTSGSYWGNMETTNHLIATLMQIERETPNFKLQVVSCSTWNEIVKGDDRCHLCADGGNRLDETIWNCKSKTYDPKARNYGIALFDGDAWSNCHSAKKVNAKVFNNKAFTIISDCANESAFRKYCPNAKLIITSYDYNTYLQREFCNVLQNLF